LQASETLLKTVGEIALIGSRGLDAVRLATRWTDQVYVIHELPVGGTAISAKPMPISFAALPAASQAATSSRFLRVELWRSPAPGAELLSRTLSVFAGALCVGLRGIFAPYASIAFCRMMSVTVAARKIGATVAVMVFDPSFRRLRERADGCASEF
jgi:hypothetical protein